LFSFNKFELRAPSAQNLIDIFSGKWASNIGRVYPGLNAGTAELFADPRPTLAAQLLGTNGRLDAMNVLELGPLEAGHTYQLEQLGANITAVEANCEAYLKCLLVKELLNLRNARFLLGDFSRFLEETALRFDVIFASGVLYHMPDPLKLIQLIANRTGKCFVWSHYYDPDHYPGAERTRRTVKHEAGRFTYYELEYPDMNLDVFWGGNRPVASWLTRKDMLNAFRVFGFEKISVVQEQIDHPFGACMSFTAQRS
jgi:SAM-dependent methyltransferase